MIPKVIHYCWFGHGKLPSLAEDCIASWRKFCPDYEIKEWNEDNFDLNLYPYARKAYENRKFAFVADVVRLYALYTEGGLYMDTDVEVLKPLDRFLNLPAFSGFESNNTCLTGLMGAEKKSLWAKDLLEEYKTRTFVNADGTLNTTTNVMYTTAAMLKKGMKLIGKEEAIPHYVTFFPSDYFCPKSWETGIIKCTQNTYTIHHFAASWHTPEEQRDFLLKMSLTRRFRFLPVKIRYYVVKFLFLLRTQGLRKVLVDIGDLLKRHVKK